MATTQAITDCIHHWNIAKPDGSTWLPGKCWKCGEDKKFRATAASKKPLTKKVVEEKDEDSLEELAEEESKQGDYGEQKEQTT